MADFKDHIPSFPTKFGADEGEFFNHYDKIQDELDAEIVKRVKDNLDALLVFRIILLTNTFQAGLFAGVNTAFLALTLILLEPDPVDDISDLLQQFMEGLKSPTSLPSMTFAPSHITMVINTLFALSLASALFASFFAVLGKQWLMFYCHRDGGGVDRQRWDQLRRSLGAERWGLVPILEVVLPILIQIALIIFAGGFVIFLGTMNKTLARWVLVPLLIAGFFFVVTVALSLWDASCPFRNPISEGFIHMQSAVSRLRRNFRRYKQAWVKKEVPPAAGKPADQDEKVKPKEEDDGILTSNHSEGDVEKGLSETPEGADSDSTNMSTTTLAKQPRSIGRLWAQVCNWGVSKKLRAMIDLKPRLRESVHGLTRRRMVEEEKVLQVESIKRVINISDEPDALYHAALNLRSIKDIDLLRLVCEDENTTRGLRECYLEALGELEKVCDPVNKHPELLRKTLALGTAFFHVAFSAASFDDFITIIGMKGVSLPLSGLELSSGEAQIAGESCRRAQSFVRQFMSLQMRRLGRQPVALTSTTLAANAFWYAINGIPHSQDLVCGYHLRGAVTSSEVSWAGLGLLASVSNTVSEFEDASQTKLYGFKEVDWYRKAFLRVRETYFLRGPTGELADGIRDSLRTGKNLGSNAILFKSSWERFSNDDEEDNPEELGERALSEGHVLLCALETAIRDQKAIMSKEKEKYKDAMKYLKNNSTEIATKDVEALSAEVAISEEEATRALKELSPKKALINGPYAPRTSEAFRVAFRAAISALASIGARAALVGLEARIDSQTEKNSKLIDALEVVRLQLRVGALPGIRSKSAARGPPMTYAQAASCAWSMIGSRVAMSALTAARKDQEVNTPLDAISQAATSARKALRALKATGEHQSAREMCFKAMIECMGSRDAEFSILKRTSWRQKLALKTATAYMNYIIEIKQGDNDDADFARSAMKQIRAAQIRDPRVVAALGTEHAETTQEFEKAFSTLWPSELCGSDDGLQQVSIWYT
ncbi:hypothetical protein FRC01_004545 [Tulasnella sp. 417]|nr:hypothetical protein FRC01_004545 [Tulasnella sp. 417]